LVKVLFFNQIPIFPVYSVPAKIDIILNQLILSDAFWKST